MTITRRVFLSLCLLSFPFTSFAWNALGHMVVASIAYQQLNPTAREKVDELLTYFQKEYPDLKSFPEVAPWPDAIRSQKIESFTHWHYIDTAFSNDATPLKNLIDSDNAVWAFNKIVPVVKNNRANPFERARFLAFLTHIVGDLHQPLHTVSFISAAHPDGDRGGNSYHIHYKLGKSESVNVHRLWDGGVGNFEAGQTPETAASIANAISASYPKAYFGEKVNDLSPEHWADEGVNNAKRYVYNTPENEVPAQDYIDTGKQVAMQQAALAGYRLGVLLNQVFAN